MNTLKKSTSGEFDRLTTKFKRVAKDPAHIFRCYNGTVDLRTGELTPYASPAVRMALAMTPYEFLPQSVKEPKRTISNLYRLSGHREYDAVKSANVDVYLDWFARLALGRFPKCENKAVAFCSASCAGKTALPTIIREVLGHYAQGVSLDGELNSRVLYRNSIPQSEITRAAFVNPCSPEEIKNGKGCENALIEHITGKISARRILYSKVMKRPRFRGILVFDWITPDFPELSDSLLRRIHLMPTSAYLLPEHRNPDYVKEVLLAEGDTLLTKILLRAKNILAGDTVPLIKA